jgi:hypothetical protein
MVRSLPGRPFLRKVDVARFKAKHRFWPPPDASPVIPIEPWGKKFFVYNGVKNVEILGDSRASDWGNTRPRWWREDIALSLLKEGEDPNQILRNENVDEETLNEPRNQTHTHVCITDFRSRPLLYLSKEELSTLVANLDSIKEEMKKFKEIVRKNEAKEIEELNIALDDDKYMHIRRGRVMNPPSRTGRGVMSAPNRPPKRKPSSN